MRGAVTLPDGRNLSFAEYGRQRGTPVLFCHGVPGSRLHISGAMSRSADALNARIIAPDRPGFGGSDPAPSGSYMDWARDAFALLDELEISHCGVLGYSLGAPYALACAHAMPGRVTGVSLVAAMAPNMFDPAVGAVLPQASRGIFAAARDDPAQVGAMLRSVAPDGASLFAIYESSMSAPDTALLAQPPIAEIFRRDCGETLRQGHDAISADLIRYVQPWGFDLGTIRTPVQLWHGLEDINAPAAMAHHLAERLPNVTLRWFPGEGHICLIPHWDMILGSLI